MVASYMFPVVYDVSVLESQLVCVLFYHHRTYLINATSKQDRDEWIEAIRNATPSMGQHKRASSPQPYVEESRPSFPPPYSASASPARQYSSPPAPPSVEKGRDIGTEFNPTSYRDDRNTKSTPSRGMEEQRRLVPTPVEPPKPPVRQFPTASTATPPSNSALSMPPPALPWQIQQQRMPAEVKKPLPAPARPKPPVRQFPAEIAAIMDKGVSKSAEPKRDGEQWIKELRKSTTSKPTTKPANGGYPGSTGPSSSSDFKQVRDGWARSGSKPPPSVGSSAKTTDIKKKPLPPPPPPLPPEPSSVYVNIDDIEDDDVDSSSDEDSPQPPPYVPRPGRKLHWAPDIKTPVNFEALGRQMNGKQRLKKRLSSHDIMYKHCSLTWE